jgi:branched-chain amino acid transport system substrate-binding protein
MRIGLLLPDSDFYPYLGVDFKEGFINNLPAGVEIFEEDTKSASPDDLQKAARKLILKNNVDVITGWIGYRGITALLPLVKQTKTAMIMCNAGEAPIIKADINPFVVHCSLSFFDATYLTAKWAFDKFGNDYSSILSFYDAGYPFSASVSLASDQCSGTIKQIQVVREDAGKNTKYFWDKTKENPGSFIFGSFSGREAVDMMSTMKEFPGISEIPFIASPMFTDQVVLDQAGIKDVYSIKTWMNGANDINHELNNHFRENLGRNLSQSGMLGYDAASILQKSLDNGWKPKTGLTSHLENVTIESRRGNLTFNPKNNCFNGEFSLFKTVVGPDNNHIDNQFIKRIEANPGDIEILSSIQEEYSGWLNSYLCV